MSIKLSTDKTQAERLGGDGYDAQKLKAELTTKAVQAAAAGDWVQAHSLAALLDLGVGLNEWYAGVGHSVPAAAEPIVFANIFTTLIATYNDLQLHNLDIPAEEVHAAYVRNFERLKALLETGLAEALTHLKEHPDDVVRPNVTPGMEGLPTPTHPGSPRKH